MSICSLKPVETTFPVSIRPVYSLTLLIPALAGHIAKPSSWVRSLHFKDAAMQQQDFLFAIPAKPVFHQNVVRHAAMIASFQPPIRP